MIAHLGLRAKMEAGFSRMNDVTVIQASQGLAQYIRESAAEVSVVIGYDHRHNSERFARLTAAAMLKAGVKVRNHCAFHAGGGGLKGVERGL